MPRLSFDVSPEFDKVLRDLAEKTDATSTADVIRRAVASYKFLKERREDTDQDIRITLTDRKSGTVRDVILP